MTYARDAILIPANSFALIKQLTRRIHAPFKGIEGDRKLINMSAGFTLLATISFTNAL